MSASQATFSNGGVSSLAKTMSASVSTDSGACRRSVTSMNLPLFLAAPPDSGFRFGFLFALFDGLALVVGLLAAREGDFAFYQSILQIDLGGNQRESLVACLAVDLVDLGAMEQH